MKQREYIFIIIILILVIIIIFQGCGSTSNKKDLVYDYKTDSSSVKEVYIPKPTLKDTTPPKLVILWRDSPPELIPYKVEIIPDSLKILIRNLEDSLKSVIVDNKFLTNFPSAFKLVDFKLDIDTLNITTLNLDGKIKSMLYPLDFHKYKYEWHDNELHHGEFKRKKPKNNNKLKQFYIMGGYDFIKNAPLMDLNYNIDIQRIKVAVGTTIHIATDPNITGTAKIGFRLFK